MIHYLISKVSTGDGRVNKPATAVLGLLLLCPPVALADDAGVQAPAQVPAQVREQDGVRTEVPAQTQEQGGVRTEVPVQTQEQDGVHTEVPAQTQEQDGVRTDLNLRLHSSPYPYVGAAVARGGYADTRGIHLGVKFGYMFSSRVGVELGYFQFNDTSTNFGGNLHDWSGFHLGPTWNFALTDPRSNILLNTSVAQVESVLALLFKFGYAYVWDSGLYLSAEVNAVTNFSGGGLPLHYGIGFGYRFF